MGDATRILHRIESGDRLATSELFPIVYEELRRLATRQMAGERPDHTLQTTALVHEAYLRLVDTGNELNWESRGHFFSAAAEAMRRILIDSARSKQSQKRGGNRERMDLEAAEALAPMIPASLDVIALSEALDELAMREPQKAELVKLRFFAGLTIEQAGHALGISTPSAVRKWRHARAWLARQISGSVSGNP